MSNALQQPRGFKLSAKKLGVSACIAATLITYAVQKQNANAATVAAATTLQPASATLYQNGDYIDGEYTGSTVRADRWGNVQVKVIIENGEIADVQILEYPHSTGHSNRISHVALPQLMQEALDSQSASVDIISGATPTSKAFIKSLQSALDSAESNL